MKKRIVAGLFIAMVFIGGCALQTKNSIDNGSAEVPAWLKGKWYEVKQSGRPEGYDVEPVKGKTGHLKAYALDSLGNHKGGSFEMIMSDVGGTLFLNVYEAEDEFSAGGWYIYKFTKISNKEFRITALKERLVSEDISSTDLKAFLMKNKDHEDIYNESESGNYRKQ